MGGQLGYKSNPLRYEAEVTYINAVLTGFKLNNVRQTGVTGQTNEINVMANIYYDFTEMVPSVEPFIGAGIGYGLASTFIRSKGPNGHTKFEGSSSVFAYQGIAGFTYNFAENYAVYGAYRYIGTSNVHVLNKPFQAHLGNVGVTYRFDGSTYK